MKENSTVNYAKKTVLLCKSECFQSLCLGCTGTLFQQMERTIRGLITPVVFAQEVFAKKWMIQQKTVLKWLKYFCKEWEGFEPRFLEEKIEICRIFRGFSELYN